jgi:hypothetical protein
MRTSGHVLLQRVPLAKLAPAPRYLALIPLDFEMDIAHVHGEGPPLAKRGAASRVGACVVATALVNCVHMARERPALAKGRVTLRALEAAYLEMNGADVSCEVGFGHEGRATFFA